MNRQFVVFLAAVLAASGWANGAARSPESAPLIHQVENLPGSVGTPVLLGDRYEYGDDEREAVFYLARPAPVDTNMPAAVAPTNGPLAADLHLSLTGPQKVLAEAVVQAPLSPKTHFLVRVRDLPAGRYTVRASLRDAAQKPVTEPLEWSFVRTNRASRAIAFPADGLPVEVEAQTLLPDLEWPFHASIPLPPNAVDRPDQLWLEEDGRPVLCQFAPAATWGPGGSVRWGHLLFTGRYRGGKPAGYRLKGSSAPPAMLPVPDKTHAVRVREEKDRLVVENGTVRFTVNRKAFSGIEQAWFDATGRGQYGAPLVSNTLSHIKGPYLVDGRLIRYEAAADKDAQVEVEENGPVRVTIAATGWYVDPRPRGGKFCQFKTRITCSAGQPAIRVSHHTIISYDTRTAMLADSGFPIPVASASAYRFGLDRAEKAGVLPNVPADPQPDREGIVDIPSVYLHQDRSDHVRLMSGGTQLGEGTRSDGWAAVRLTNRAEEVGVILRDVWQKFPKEIELARTGLTLHFWPAHGRRAFAFEDELALKNIYKFWCFHQHPLLDLTLPPDYFQALTADWEETRECKPSHALNGNGEGLAIGNEFEIRFMADSAPAADPRSPALIAKVAELVQLDPVARTPADWNARSGAFDRLAAPDSRFKAVEETFEKGMMAYNGSVERGQDYGMWIWADTHTYWKIDENRASLHRVWQNSHYHQVGNSWAMWFRSGSPELLRWARIASDHYRNVSTINYTTLDEEGRSPLKFHRPGAMYHCKGCTPWGGEQEGMVKHDTHAGTWGHWTDPDAHLWAWLMDANPRASDLYDLWLSSAKRWGLLSTGSRREANNTLAMACSAYEYTWDADFLPVIHGLGLSLRTKEPLEKQFPGPLWHPLWMNRYYHLTRDPEYVPFILKYARYPSLGDTWTLGLSALAYELSGDATFLTQHMNSLHNLPRTLYRDPGEPYDGYGKGPGPLGFRWGEMAWGQFLGALQDAGIQSVQAPADPAPGVAPLEAGRRIQRSVVYALKTNDAPWTLHFRGAGIEGDFVKSQFRLEDPDGKPLDERTVLQANAPRFDLEVPAGKPGLYRLSVTGHGVFSQAATTLDAHASLLKTNTTYLGPAQRGFLAPLGAAAPLQIEIGAAGDTGDRIIVNALLLDAGGKTIGQSSLCKYFRNKSAVFKADPAVHPLPWRLDVMGAIGFRLVSDSGTWVLAPSPRDLDIMTPRLKGVAGPEVKP